MKTFAVLAGLFLACLLASPAGAQCARAAPSGGGPLLTACPGPGCGTVQARRPIIRVILRPFRPRR